MAGAKYILLFDDDCGVCRAAARWLRALNRTRIEIRPILGSRELLRGVPGDRHLDAFHIVAPDGRVTTAGDALPTVLEALPMGAGLARLVRESAPLSRFFVRVYPVVARLRDGLTCRVRASPVGTAPAPRG